MDLMTADEAAEQLRVTRRTVYEWLKEGRLRGVKVGRLWRIHKSDVDELLRPKEAKRR